MIIVVGPRDADHLVGNSILVNTTSRSKDWGKGLSPFYLGPCELYQGYTAKNVENAWQFSKVYPAHADINGDPTEKYWAWARQGWADSWASRYPMGKGAVPLYSYWDGRKLSYVEARKTIYIPLYSRAVRNTELFSKLRECVKTYDHVYLWDFDGYDYGRLGITLEQVKNDSKRKMGHAFVLAMMLEGII
jgi:hypothetical protein